MKREHIVDLTSLLDLMLILLFAFMINMAGSVREQKENTEVSQKSNEALQNELDQQGSQMQQLMEQLAQDKIQIEALENKNVEEAQSLKTQLATLSEWMGANQPIVSEVVGVEQAEKLVESEVLNATLQKYEAISKYYVFVDIELQTGDSHILINGVDTGIYILEPEIVTSELKDVKQLDVEDLISTYMDNLKGGYSFALITLSEDGQVKRAQYNLVWEAIKAVQQKKSIDKVFITQIQTLKP